MRGKLKMYNDAVYQQSIISRQPIHLDTIFDLYKTGLSDQTWGILPLPEKTEIPGELSNEPPSNNMYLLVIKSGEENDVFFTWLSQKFIRWLRHIFWHRIKKADEIESGISSYEDKTLRKYTLHIIAVIAFRYRYWLLLLCIIFATARVVFISTNNGMSSANA